MQSTQFTPEFKARVVLDILTGVQSEAEICRKHSLGPNLVGLWKTSFLERAHLAFHSEPPAPRSWRGSPSWSRSWDADPGERDPKKSLEQAG